MACPVGPMGAVTGDNAPRRQQGEETVNITHAFILIRYRKTHAGVLDTFSLFSRLDRSFEGQSTAVQLNIYPSTFYW